ncbi:hypothetical protein LTS03_006641 [Exophiala xenobiotica]|nr:hypothetical protein LTR61_007338 [Exophiala xenobiotica]KAK5372953.1 hypothetical protein LTS03_006641 [Exophiala xenobiotica]KAK5377586.1 hypothetical protein LTS13_004456 [Exophiala xenobiotica]KAK5420634.1 hypothetical protein LTR90_003527 [Exophiala xenobiotica]KAK5498766.1 hypothetical protein LTR83_004074 [Exophiala xenobiotica]
MSFPAYWKGNQQNNGRNNPWKGDNPREKTYFRKDEQVNLAEHEDEAEQTQGEEVDEDDGCQVFAHDDEDVIHLAGIPYSPDGSPTSG